MKAKDLRIGNLIKYQNETLDVKHLKTTLSLCGDKVIYYREIEPIQLTEEWLIKFGFVKEIDGYSLDPLTIGKYWIRHNFAQLIQSDKIKYVHTLQNLYFALTGKEL